MPFTENKEGQTNSYTSIAQVVIQGMKEFHNLEHEDGCIFQGDIRLECGCAEQLFTDHINETIIKVLEAIEKEVGRKIRTREDTFECPHCEEDLRGIVNNEFSPIQQLLNSTKEQIK